jgi:glucose-6-phosphate dehydrogenase assembly protein OpcA
MIATVEPERILKELRKLWIDLGKQEEHGVLRACAMTFIVATADLGDDQELGEMIASLMHEHPSRAIVLRIRPEGQLDARVFAQCWMPFGKHQQICCEQVEITSPEQALDEAASVITGIAVPDLPVVLYLRTPALVGNAALAPVLPLATKIVVDSSRTKEAAPVLKALDASRNRGTTCADLAWARLTPWREAISRLFDHQAARDNIGSLDEVRIVHAGPRAPVSAYYFGGWFWHALGRQPRIRIEAGDGASYNGIVSVAVHAPGGFDASVRLLDCCQIETQIGGVSQRLVFPAESEGSALHEELGILGLDSIYEDALGLAKRVKDAAG